MMNINRGFSMLEYLIFFALIAVIVLAAVAIVLQILKYLKAKNEIKAPSNAPQEVLPAAPLQATQDDEAEILAVITAALNEYTGSEDFTIKNIAPNDRPKTVSNWVLSGRIEAFQSRRVIRK